ncbi:MAG: DUF721 domain-containing protein [candidate division Zixibacteria bacterium]|nr:DUF721 domain-containing protein [candidate division Zixibacteria bacterium]
MKSNGNHHPRRISGIVGDLMQSLGLSVKYNGWLVVTKWPEIVGPTIAERARAKRFVDGVLVIAVPDDSWRQQLAMQIEPILRKIQAQSYGRTVRQIRLERG